VASHEVAHALAFSPSYPVFAQAEAAGSLHDTDLGAYYGTGLYVDPSSHFTQAVDPASLRGAFGNHYAGQMPPRRWLITKLDLLAMQAIGYRLRPTSPFEPLAIQTDRLPPVVSSSPTGTPSK
jgi:hypothetical protein